MNKKRLHLIVELLIIALSWVSILLDFSIIPILIIFLGLVSIVLLVEDKETVEPKKIEEQRQKYERENNTLLKFIEECCYINDESMPSLRLKRSIFKEAYDKYIKLNFNGRGKINNIDMNYLLQTYYDETFIKSNGIWYMKKILLLPEAKQELGIYENNEKISDF